MAMTNSKERFKIKVLGFNSMANGPAPATPAPLALYWHSGRGDFFSTATSQGERDALAAGYKLVRTEGFIFPPQ